MKKVYLAGPITGVSWNESEDWRDNIKCVYEKDGFRGESNHHMHRMNVEFFSPLRGKDYLKQETDIKDTYENTHFSSAKAIMERDFYDVQTCDAVIANFNGAKKVSIGTVMEIAWAYQFRKPVIVIRGEDTFHDHSMVNQATWYVVSDEYEALTALSFIFNP